MSDPMDVMLDYNDEAYSELIKQADVDERVGKHNAIITKITDDTWDDGRPRRKILFSLLSAGNAKADLTVSPPPPPDVVKAESSKWEPKRRKGVAHSVTIFRQFAQHYGVNPMRVSEGDEFRVETNKTRREKDGSGGFIRVVAILPKAEATNGAASGGPNF